MTGGRSVQAKETLKKLPKQKNNTNDLPRPFKKHLFCKNHCYLVFDELWPPQLDLPDGVEDVHLAVRDQLVEHVVAGHEHPGTRGAVPAQMGQLFMVFFRS